MKELTNYMLDGLLRHLRDDTDLLRICSKTIPYSIFDGTCIRVICKTFFKYYDTYGKAPKTDFEDYFFEKNCKLSGEEKELYEKIFQRIKSSDASKEYVVRNLGEYIETQSFQQTLLKGADFLQRKDLEGIRKEFKNALKGTFAFNDAGDDIWNFKPLPEEDTLVSPTRIEALDKKIRGYNRKELFLWMAPTNRGKSWALIDGATAALFAGKNVVYYTLEMSKDKVQHRLWMAMSGLRRNARDERNRLEIIYFDGTTEDLSDRKSVYTDEKTLELAKKRYKRNGGSLRTVQLRGGSSTVEDLERHLSLYELTEGKMPDIIFVDYADLLATHKKFSEDINEIDHVYTSLRVLAVEKNIAVVTASQSNRLGLDAKTVTLKHIAKSLGKATIADAIITLNQTESEYWNNIMRLNVAKMREGERDYEIEMKQCFEIGAFCLESRLKQSASDMAKFDDEHQDEETVERDSLKESKVDNNVNDNKDKSSHEKPKNMPNMLFKMPEYCASSVRNNGDGGYTA